LSRSDCNRASPATQSYALSGRPLLASAGLALLLAGCATHNYNLPNVERRLAADQPELALQSLERQSQSWGRRDKVLYLLNRAMLLRMQGKLAASNKAFTEAQRLIDKLYGVSVTERIGSVIINDRTRSYVGEEFEQVLLHVYMALNFLEMNQLDAARVEALQIDLLLRQFSKKIAKNKYIEDAFARYLSGLIYEQEGEWSDALIEYRKAYEAYGEYQRAYGTTLPRSLQYDLLRLTAQLGLADEHQRYQQEFGINDDMDDAAYRDGQGQLVFVLHSGLAPVKRENAVILPVPGSYTLVKIALPYYQSRSNPAKGARLQVADKELHLELAEDVNAIAIRDLEMKMPAIEARALARASIKGAVVGGLNRQDQWLAGLLVQLGGLATEHADTRSWITLPRDIYIGCMLLPPGKYTLRLELLDRYDAVLSEHEFPDVQITKQHMTFVSYHWIVPTNLLFESAR
jgi:uncharacterized protein